MGKVSQGQGFYSSHGLVLIPCVVPHDLGGSFLSLLRGWFLIGKVCHWKAFPWQGLPMARPPHGKAFPWKGLLIGKVSQGQGFYSSHGLVLIPCVVPHDLGGCFLWLLLGWFLIGKVCHWKGFPWQGLPMARPPHGKASPWQGLPMARPSHGKAFPWEGLPMERPSHWQGFSGARFLFITWACPHPMCCSP